MVPAGTNRLGRSPSIEVVGEEFSPVGEASGTPWYALPGESPPRPVRAARPRKFLFCFLLYLGPRSPPPFY